MVVLVSVVAVVVSVISLVLVVNSLAAIVSHWDTLLRLLGRHLHSKTSLINTMMTVIEKAFKIQDSEAPGMLQASFRSWRCLMENFALDPKVPLLHCTISLQLFVLTFSFEPC